MEQKHWIYSLTAEDIYALIDKAPEAPVVAVVLATNRWSVVQAAPGPVEHAVATASPGAYSVVTF